MKTLRKLPPELAKIAKEELGEENDHLVNENLQRLKTWLVSQPHLNARLDDQYLIAFLRGCKHNVEKATKKLENLYTLKATLSKDDLYLDPMDPKIQHILSQGIMVPVLKTSSPDGERILIYRPGAYNAYKVTAFETAKVYRMMFEILMLEDENVTVVGQRELIDLGNISMGHILQLSLSNMKKLVAMGQDITPVRRKSAHYINLPFCFDALANVMKRFLNEKFKLRVFAHRSSLDEMYDYIPKKVLPTEYGGDDGPIQDMIDYWKQKVESYREWFLEDHKFIANESKREKKPKSKTKNK